ncbi:MAG: sulfotransferase [Gammaproteobacteria bacterium]
MERIVIGTGRCGSTLLSDLIAMHPRTMVLSEFFTALDPARGWPHDRDIDAAEFAAILAREDGIGPAYMAQNRSIGEVLVDLEAEKAAHAGFLNRPTIQFIAMPFLAPSDPLGLYQGLVSQVRTQPRQSLRTHFQGAIGWLQRRQGKDAWVERSGLSTNTFRAIRRTFPDARFVHIHRDGAESALSMLNHVHMRLMVSYHFDPPTGDELRRTLDLSLPPADNPLVQRLEHPLPAERFGEYWSWSLALTYRELPYLPPDQLHEVRFEDLMANPRGVLEGIEGFLELPAAGREWIDAAVARVRQVPTRANLLDPQARERLEAACRPGNILLGRDPGACAGDAANQRLVELLNAR